MNARNCWTIGIRIFVRRILRFMKNKEKWTKNIPRKFRLFLFSIEYWKTINDQEKKNGPIMKKEREIDNCGFFLSHPSVRNWFFHLEWLFMSRSSLSSTQRNNSKHEIKPLETDTHTYLFVSLSPIHPSREETSPAKRITQQPSWWWWKDSYGIWQIDFS